MTEDRKLFLTRHYPATEARLRADGGAAIFGLMQQYIGSDAVLPKLEQNHPGEQIFYSADLLTRLYAETGTTGEGIAQTIKDCPDIQDSWKHLTKPQYWPPILVLRWMTLNGTAQDRVKMAVMFLAVLIYAGPGLQFKYFRRHYQANAMAYAMNTLSDKFILKQEGTMFKAIVEVAWRAHQRYDRLLRAGDDVSLRKYFASFWGRLNGMIRSLAGQYYDTYTKGLYLNQSKERHDDGELRDRETDGGRVSSTADHFTELFLGEVVPTRAVDLASQIGDAPRQSVMLAVSEIRNGDGERVRETFQLITELFFEERGARREDIRTRGFLEFATAVYTRSNTKDGRVERLKQILNAMLLEHSPHYLRTNREASKGAFRKSLYLTFVLFMQMKA